MQDQEDMPHPALKTALGLELQQFPCPQAGGVEHGPSKCPQYCLTPGREFSLGFLPTDPAQHSSREMWDSLGKRAHCQPDDPSVLPGPTWWEKRTHRLPSDLHTHCVAPMSPHSYTINKCNKNKSIQFCLALQGNPSAHGSPFSPCSFFYYIP